MSEQPQRTLKGYQLFERVGAGGFGEVYRAFQPTVGREVAIKVILPQFANQPDFIRRFETEAQTIARLEHPHIVPLYDYWRDADGAYLVMRWLRTSLSGALREGAWSVEAAARLLDQIAAALTVAHRTGVIHRDIKPDNILLDEDDNAYLADFGIAKDLHQASVTQEGAMVGSPAYMTPEQIRGEALTAQTDIYNLGLVLYQTLVNRKPYPDTSTPYELIQLQLSTPLPDLHAQRPELPAALNEVLQTATAKVAAERYATAQRFAAAFRAALPAPVARTASQPLPEPLTTRELEILGLIVEGMSNAEIAQKLVLALETVKWYVKQIFAKLDVHSRYQAVEWARRLNLMRVAPAEVVESEPMLRSPITNSAAEATELGEIFDIANPYKGLRAFQEADAADYFGREALTRQLTARLGQDGQESRFLAVVGPSGSGKSSVVKAGLIPALRQGALPGSKRWFIVEMLPGAHPLEELEAALLRVAVNPPSSLIEQLQKDERGLPRAIKRVLPDDDSELLLVIDQFEEIFTLLEDQAARVHFLDSLLAAVTEPRSRVRVVVTLRADFYDRPLQYAEFGDLVRKRTEVVLPLSPAELEEAIAGPARRSGLILEPGLTAAILADVGEQPGTLPLLEYALTELFERREGRTLTVAAFRTSGGVLGALARRADQLFTGLDEIGQVAARQLFLRLVSLGEGSEDTRRRVRRTELVTSTDDDPVLDGVIDAFSQYRLLTFDRDPVTRGPTVEVAHEALIRTWSRLRGWLDDSREDLRLHRRLTLSAAEWIDAERDPGFLATGTPLDQFTDWVERTTLALNPDERAYLDASVADRAERRALDEARKMREAQIARRAQNFGRAAAALAVVGVLAVIATLVAITQAANAGTREATATVAQGLAIQQQQTSVAREGAANTQVALVAVTLSPVPPTLTALAQKIERGNNQVESLRLAAAAKGVLQADGANAEIAALLGIRALKTAYSAQADAVLVQAVERVYTRKIYVHESGYSRSVTFAPDGKTFLTGNSDATARLWNVQSGQALRTFSGHKYDVRSVAFAPDDKTILTGGAEGTARLWDVQSGVTQRIFAVNGVHSVAFAPDGKTVLIGGGNFTGSNGVIEGSVGIASLWDVQSGQTLRIFSGHTNLVYSVAFAPDGKTILTGSEDSTARLWDLQSGQSLRTFSGHIGRVNSVAFAPDGKTFLTGGRDQTARLWDLQSGQTLRTFSGHTGEVISVAFAPDGKTILTGGDDTARLWDVQNVQGLRTFSGHTGEVFSVAFAPDGKTILTGSGDSSARLWDVQSGQTLRIFNGNQWGVNSVAFAPDGKTILTVNFNDCTVCQWDAQSGALLRTFSGDTDPVYSVAFAPDGKTILTGSQDNSARLWDVQSGQTLRTFSGHTDYVISVAFAPDGKTILTGSQDNSARLWDVQSGQTLRTFSGHTGTVNSVAFAPDGKTILTGSDDNSARLWDLQSGQVLRTFSGHTDAVYSVAFAPDGKTIVTGSQDNSARLWDVQSGQTLRTFSGHTGAVNSVAFAPDGKTILTGSQDNSARLWNTDYRDWIAYACLHVFRDLTDDERQRFSINDKEPTCPQFGVQTTPMPPTTTPISNLSLPVSTPIASPTSEPTFTPSPTDTATVTPTYPGILLTFTPSPTATP